MKRGLLGVSALVALLVGAAPAHAKKDMAGKLGIGADSSIGGSSGGAGLAVKYWVIPKFGVEAIIGFSSDSRDAGGVKQSQSSLDLSLLGFFALLEAEGFSFDVGGGLNVARSSSGVGDMDTSTTGLSLEVGAGPTWWVTDKFALNLMLGLVLDLDAEGGGTAFDLFGSANRDLVGGAGFTLVIN